MRVQKYLKSSLLFFLPLLTIIFLSNINSAYAAGALDGAVKEILNTFQTHSTAWENTLQGYALKLFWLLAGIEFLWTAIKLVFRNADLGEFLAELTNRILYIGFFLTLLLHSSNWASAIVQSFTTAANNASSAAGGLEKISPVVIIHRGLTIVSEIWTSLTSQDLQHSIPLAIAGLVILVCFAFMAANMIEALIESYIVISAGVLFMGFGGSSWTSDLAKKILMYAISVGAKLFVLQLIMGLGETLVKEWANNFNPIDLEDVLVILGCSLIMTVLSKSIPAMVQGLLNGTSVGGGGITGSIGAAAATMMEAASLMATQGRSGQSQPNKDKDKDSDETPTATPRMIDPYLRANPDAKTDGGLGHRPGNNSYPSQGTSNTISPEKDD